MRPITLLVILDEEGQCDPHAAEETAPDRFPGVPIDRVVPLEEERLGAWMHANRGKRCRTLTDVLRTPERQQPVVVDIDL
jgi:hypothetical protein